VGRGCRFLRQNGAISSAQLASADQDSGYELVIAVADSRLTEVDQIADALRKVF
jgi:death-on-curing protein